MTMDSRKNAFDFTDLQLWPTINLVLLHAKISQFCSSSNFIKIELVYLVSTNMKQEFATFEKMKTVIMYMKSIIFLLAIFNRLQMDSMDTKWAT